MIFRALFWIGLVSLLAPHEPDIGLGHPGAGTFQPISAMLQSGTSHPLTGRDCGWACAGGLGVFHLNMDAGVLAGLANVKAQIEADQRARAERGKTV